MYTMGRLSSSLSPKTDDSLSSEFLSIIFFYAACQQAFTAIFRPIGLDVRSQFISDYKVLTLQIVKR